MVMDPGTAPLTNSAPPARGGKTRRPSWPLATGLLGMLVFTAFGFAVAANVEHPFTQPLDDWWRALVGATNEAQIQNPIVMLFQEIGQIGGAVLMVIVIPGWLFIIRRWRSALFVLAAEFGVSIVVSQVVKNLVDRPRPAADAALGLSGPLIPVDHGSFPSGHGVSVGILVVAIAAILPVAARKIWWIVGAVLAIGMIWQRTFVNAHWISDAIVGVIGGASATLLLWWLFWRLLDRDRGKPLFRRVRADQPRESVAR